ncbi:MAG: DUF342 domain-containing protein [Oscillospiraceae bacterium]
MADIIANVDCSYDVTVSPGNKEAFVFVKPPSGTGKHVTEEGIKEALKVNNVVFGYRDDMIKMIVNERKYSQKLCVAVAQLPVDGVSGSITYKYAKTVEAAPTENEKGFVDYKDLGLIRIIRAGDVIADITLPTEGEPGIDVRGGKIQQYPGKKAQFSVGTNTKITDDGLHIVAAVDGQLVFKSNAFSVDTTVTINGDVDASIGNINFIGDVIIKGNICEGFKVSSNSNITVSGEVNGATLEAGGNITIKQGCIYSKITCHGNVSALFCERSSINCDGDISAQNYVICDIYCAGELITKASNGSIIGGKYIVLNSLEASNIGSKTYTPTDITLGDNAILADEKTQLEMKIAATQKKIDDLTMIVNFLNEKKKELHKLPEEKEEMLATAVRQRVISNVEIKNSQKRIEEINVYLGTKQQLWVKCKGYIYPGTRITINDNVFKADMEYAHSMVSIGADGEISAMPY